MVNVLIYKLESVRKPSGKVINEFVDKEVTSEEAKKILKSRIECKSEIMYDRIENKKLIKGAPEDYNWVDYKLSFDKLTVSRVSKSKVSKLKRASYFFKFLKYDIGNMVAYNNYKPDELSELMELVLKQQISENAPLGDAEWFHTDMERLYRNQTRQNMCNFLLCSGANVNKVSTNNHTLLFKALQTLIIEKHSKQLAVKATVERLLDSSRIMCDDIYEKYIWAETPIHISNITERNIELTRKNIDDSRFNKEYKAILHERLDTFLEQKNEYYRTHKKSLPVKSDNSNEDVSPKQMVPSIHIESSPQTNSPETKRMLRRWSNYHTEHLRKHPLFNPSKRVSYANIVGKNLSNGSTHVGRAGNKQSKKKKQKQPSTPRQKKTQKQKRKPKKKATQRKQK